MVILNESGLTTINFISSDLTKGQVYNTGGDVTLTDLYSGDNVIDALGKTLSPDGFKHRVLFNAAEFTNAGLVIGRRYDLTISLNNEVVYRDIAIYSSQDLTEEGTELSYIGADDYKYLNRGTIQEYKTLER